MSSAASASGASPAQPASSSSKPAAAIPASSSTNGSSSKARKGGPGGGSAGEGGSGEDAVKPAKRKRISYSCVACSARKAKCDRQRPCGLCVSRGVGATCRYLVDGYDDPVDFLAEVRDRLDYLADVRDRLSSIEGMVAGLAGTFPPDRRSSSALPVPPSVTNTANLAPPTVVATSPASSSTTVQASAEPQAGFVSERAGGRYFGSSASASVDDQGRVASLFQAMSAPRDGQEDPAAAGEAASTSSVGGRLGGQALASEFLSCLPPRPLADFLTTFYFGEINLTRYPLSEPTFRTIYSDVWALQPTSPLPPTYIHLLPLVFIILAISALTAPANELLGLPPPRTDPNVRRELAHKLYEASCRARALADATFEGRGNILTVMGGVLLTRYLVLVRRASDGYEALGAAIHRAYALGLHRQRAGLAAAEEETRRRIWSYILHLDRYLCLLLGLPLTINEAFCDIPGPSNISDLDAVSVVPLNTLTTSSFLLLRHSLTKLMGRIATEAFGQVQVPYSIINNLEEALKDWQNTLPEFFRIVPYGESHASSKSSGGTASVLEVQRYLLATEYHFVRTTLHRPYLASPDPALAPSREACIQSALNDLWARLTAYPLRGMENLSSGSYRVTLSIVVLGVAMLLSPSSGRAKEIRDCLISFASLSGETASTPGGAASLVDEPTFREVAARELNQLKARFTKPPAVGEASGTSMPEQGFAPLRPLSSDVAAPPAPAVDPVPEESSSRLLPDPPYRVADVPLQPPTYPDIYSHAQAMLNTTSQSFPSFPSFPSAGAPASYSFDTLGFDLPDLGVGGAPVQTGGATGAEPDFAALAADGGEINWDVFDDVLSSMGGGGSL
ncbi:hypothetical protein JCM6882_003574 [Rhodosporidiobolus microsporus]